MTSIGSNCSNSTAAAAATERSSSSSSSSPTTTQRATPSISVTEAKLSVEDQMSALDEKLKRTSKFLHEIQDLSPAVEEPTEQNVRERQVRVKTELI